MYELTFNEPNYNLIYGCADVLTGAKVEYIGDYKLRTDINPLLFCESQNDIDEFMVLFGIITIEEV